MRVEKPNTCINVYRDVFTKEASEGFIKKLEKETKDEWSDLEWSNSSVGEGHVTKVRTSLGCSLIKLFKPYDPTELSEYFHKNIFEKVEAVITDYIHEHLIHEGLHEPYSVLKYYENAEYHAHYDHFRDNRRVFSVVANLGEPEDGGELEFPQMGVTVKPEVGSVIVFPSNFPYLHIAHPVKSGIKYSLVSWYS
jgi:2OG-Fe(II) oxygenase superfamily